MLLNAGNAAAQEKVAENRKIYIKKGGLFQIKFTTPFVNYSIVPATSSEFYEIKDINEKSISIVTQNENLPATTLQVEEKNGTVWNLNILYKADIDLDNDAELIFDYEDNTAENKKRNNIILTSTTDKLTLKTQEKSIPYDTDAELQQLKTTYPKINFSAYPAEQIINLAEKENYDFVFNESLYSKRADLNWAFKNDMVNIKIVCQNLIFKGNDCYLKLLIQNNSEAEFLTGNMMLTLQRQDGSTLKLYPGYIYPKQFPIIKTAAQKAVIYPFKSYNVADEDVLKFEIHDRLQKINLEFTITGSDFNSANKD
jgi:hypothetical protein